MAGADGRRKRSRGTITALSSGSLRARVYAGYDPVTGRRNHLDKVVKAGPQAKAEAERALTRMPSQIDERRNPKTRATVNQLLDRYLKVLDVEGSTRKAHDGYIKNHIRPVLGALPLSRVDGETLDSFYPQLRRCRRRCIRNAELTDHRTERAHECDVRCRPHTGRSLAASTVRQIHRILSGAFDRAVRWHWISVTPVQSAEPPAPPKSNPSPPSP